MIANAKAEEVPKATIENAIKRAANVSDQQELIYEMQGPGNVIYSFGGLESSKTWIVGDCRNLIYIECSLGVGSHFGCQTSGAIIRCINRCSIGTYLIFPWDFVVSFYLFTFKHIFLLQKVKTNYTQITHAVFLASKYIFYNYFFKFLDALWASQFEFKVL